MKDVSDTKRPEWYRFLVIGCGSIGKRHIGNLCRLGVHDIIAFDVQSSRREEVRERFGVSVVASLEEAWEYKPSVAVITVPTSLHVPLALQAAKHGCHLFIEKPLSHTMEGVDKLLREVKERGLITLVGCNMRFHPGLMRVKELIDEGTVGKVVATQVEVGQYLPDWHPFEDYRHSYSARQDLGGGVILDAIHEIDYIRWMLGEVKAVACFAGKLSRLEIETEDTAGILLRFSSGAIGEIHMDYVQRTYSRTCQIIGDEGTIRWDYTSDEVQWYSAATREWQVLRNSSGWNPNQMYLDEMQHFLRCLVGEEKPTLDVFEGVRVLEVTLAAKASAKAGQIMTLRGYR
jgi:predicted dehydrogenase